MVHPLRFLALTLLILALSPPATADRWKIFSFDSLSPGPLLVDRNGTLHTLTFEESGFVSHATFASAGWKRTPLFDGQGKVGIGAALCIDSRGVIHAAFTFAEKGQQFSSGLYYMKTEGGTWSPAQLLVSDNTGFWELSIGVDRQNRVHITSLASVRPVAPGALTYITNRSGFWRRDSLAPASNSVASVVDAEDSIHVAFYAPPLDLRYLGKGEGEWSASEFVDSVGGQREGMGLGIALDSTQGVHVSYVRGPMEDNAYALRRGGAWTHTTLDAGMFSGYGSSVAVDRNGTPHIFYHHVATGALKYATNGSGSWVTTVLDPAGRRYSRATVDSLGFLNVVYGWSSFTADRWASTLPLPKLALAPIPVDFGEVGLGKSATQVLTVRNDGDAPLVLSRIDAGGPNRSCFSWVNGCGTVSPGDSCQITLLFAPDSLADLTAALRISSNDPVSPAVVPLSGRGISSARYWAMKLHGAGGRLGGVIRQLPDGELVTSGSSNSSLGASLRFGAWIVRLSSAGELLWEKRFSSEEDLRGTTMEPLPDGGQLIGGTISLPAGTSPYPPWDGWLLRIDSTGREVWQKRFESGGDAWMHSVFPLVGGGSLAVVGVFSRATAPFRAVLLRLDDGGSILWQKAIVGPYLRDCAPKSDGGCTLLLEQPGLPLPPGEGERWTSSIVDVSATGAIQWARYIYSDLRAMQGGIVRTATGGTALNLVAHRIHASLVLEIDNLGNLLWSRKIMEGPHWSPLWRGFRRRIPGGFLSTVLGASGTLLTGYTPNGEVEWSSLSPGNLFSPLALPDSSIIVTGSGHFPDSPIAQGIVMRLNHEGLIPGCTFVQPAQVSDSSIVIELRDWTPTIEAGDLTVLPASFTSSTVQSTRTLICSLIPVEDVDGDGLGDNYEWGPSGFDPAFDGNGDGIADAQQRNVASFSSGSMGERYVTLASDSGTELKGVRSTSNPSPPTTPGALFAYDFYSFRVTGLAPGDSATVRLILHGTSWPADGYWKYGTTADSLPYHWYRFDYDGETGATISGNEITLHFVDGKRGDDDLLANGEILEPGGPGWFDTLALGVRSDPEIPAETSLLQNYPNPFNPTTTIPFDLATGTHVIIRVYDLLGREVARLANEFHPAGRHHVLFNARSLASGTYFIRFQGAGRVQTRKVLMIR